MAASPDITEKVNVFNNMSLFSNHYLKTQIPKTPEWKEDEKAQIVFNEISKHYQQNQKALAAYKESQLEDNFIRPVLKALGHFFGIQGKVADNARVPDYAFFSMEDIRDEAYQLQGTQDFYQKAIAVGDAKAWNVSLDKSQISGKGMWDKQNPSYQIDTYLRDTPPVWGLLTNGKLWRLYHESTSNKLDVYYEVDLESLLKSGDLEDFKYFYLFFRFEAFPKFSGDSFLDRAREGSQAYAREIGEELKDNIYRAMQKLAEGFFADPTNGLTRSDEDLKAVQDNSMLLLYRILFISYAESRGLLDTNNRYYHDISLQEMKKEIAIKIDAGDFLAPFSYAYWGKLNNLSDLINEGSESERWRIERKVFYIPAYNGGLFDPAKNNFLTTKHVSDPYLSEALDLLARTEKAMVDYSSLDIKHLGSIYEGLLEYKLTPDLSLLTDKGERRATGSFYTPDPEVKYIVESTLGPVLAQKKDEWFRAGSGKFADYILSIKVLDLSMGSGHFLVETVDYLARALVEAWATARKEDAKNREIAEHDIQWARREVVRKCIYGVDLNPMAVELAKLALWLTTAAANRPLSFLDHHLRCGNSLVGINLDSLVTLPTPGTGQGSLPAFFIDQRKKLIDDLLRKYGEIDSIPDDSLKAVKDKERQFKALMEDERSKRIREFANVKLSTYFGNIVKDDDYEWMSNGIDPELAPGWGGVRDLDWFKKAQQLAQEHRFFHWELEFPEAFQGEWRGFDVVIGNPPYFSMERITYLQPVFEMLHSEIYSGKLDISNYFIKKGLDLVKEHGSLGYITARYFLEAIHGLKLRDFCSKSAIIRQIVDFGNFQVFDANVLTIILILEKISSKSIDNNVKILKYDEITKEISLVPPYKGFDKFLIPSSNFTETPWFINKPTIDKFINKIIDLSSPLVDFCRIGKGMESGLNEAFVVTKNVVEKWNLEPNLIKNHVQGKDLTRYSINHRDLYLIYNENIDDLSKYPFAEAYLTQFKDKLEKRKNFILGNCKWYTYGSPLNTDIYEQANEKLIVPYMATHARFGYDSCEDKERFFTLTDTTIIVLKKNNVYNLKYILSILNSSLLNYIHQRTSKLKRDGYYEYFSKTMERLPIRSISFITPATERASQGAELQQLYAQDKYAKILAAVEACLPKDEANNFIVERERSDVVHDLLAFLAGKMLEMNKEKQQEIRGFLSWLEGYVGAKVEDLTPKTKLQGYYEHDYESFLDVLKKNKRKLAVDPGRREPGETLKTEFEGSMKKLLPLRERTRQTDDLIDTVIFKLYGLTEEEIRIVKGTCPV